MIKRESYSLSLQDKQVREAKDFEMIHQSLLLGSKHLIFIRNSIDDTIEPLLGHEMKLSNSEDEETSVHMDIVFKPTEPRTFEVLGWPTHRSDTVSKSNFRPRINVSFLLSVANKKCSRIFWLSFDGAYCILWLYLSLYH